MCRSLPMSVVKLSMKYTIRKSFYQIYALGTIKIIFIIIKLFYK